ncbi:hypothetical protein K440DRAFT_633002 [Wilcoxina mikolae CBS 423.85]|nr:hypothetical protein K440DRAFT_633002 [Wilcoxina mikolae CBS 423.85]
MCSMGGDLGRAEVGGVEDEVGWIGKWHTTGQLEAGDARGGGIGETGGLCRRWIGGVCLLMGIIVVLFSLLQLKRRRGGAGEEQQKKA